MYTTFWKIIEIWKPYVWCNICNICFTWPWPV